MMGSRNNTLRMHMASKARKGKETNALWNFQKDPILTTL
jgi:hypothetical protein